MFRQSTTHAAALPIGNTSPGAVSGSDGSRGRVHTRYYSRDATDGGRLVVNVLGAVAQWEREATAERTSAALQVLKQQGRATGGVAPYGFQFIDGRRAWHQGEQETLAAIIEHRRAGLSWAKVADKLSATGHRTRTGGQWTRQGAHQVHQAREREHVAAA